MPERLPVPVEAIPAEARLASILFDIDSIAERAQRERDLKDYTVRVIREAFTYKPTLAIETEQALRKSIDLLLEKGHEPQVKMDEEPKGKTLDQAVAERLKTYDYRAPISTKAREETTRSILRQIAKAYHPDSNGTPDDVAGAISDNDRTQAISKVAEVVDSTNPQKAEEAQRVLLETMPKYYLQMVKTLLAQGSSLAEVAVQYPNVVSEMENLRWIAFLRFPPANSYRRFQTFEDADREAANVRRKPEHHARTIACGMVAAIYEEVMLFAGKKIADPLISGEFQSIQDFMKRAFGYVGGAGEFVVQHGDRLITARARDLSRRLEEHIRALPDQVFALTEAVTADEIELGAIKHALEGVRGAVTKVNWAAGDYGRELEDEANGRRTRYSDLLSNFPDKSLLNNKIIFRKEEKFNNKNFNF